jgi:hypothetical protein
MILLVTSSPMARRCAAAITQTVGEKVMVAASVRRAATSLRSLEFSALVVDQPLVEADARGADVLLSRAGTAIPVSVNLSISAPERVARDVQAGLWRRVLEQQIALRAVRQQLNAQLNDPLTGILLSSQLALAEPALPPAVEEKLRSVYEQAMLLKSRLQAASS